MPLHASLHNVFIYRFHRTIQPTLYSTVLYKVKTRQLVTMSTPEAVAPYTAQDLQKWEELSASFPQPFATAVTVGNIRAHKNNDNIVTIRHG
jgi:hypothetical protein